MVLSLTLFGWKRKKLSWTKSWTGKVAKEPVYEEPVKEDAACSCVTRLALLLFPRSLRFRLHTRITFQQRLNWRTDDVLFQQERRKRRKRRKEKSHGCISLVEEKRHSPNGVQQSFSFSPLPSLLSLSYVVLSTTGRDGGGGAFSGYVPVWSKPIG